MRVQWAMVNGFLDQIQFVVQHSDRRLPQTWIFTSREAHDHFAMILVADEITTSIKQRRDRDGRRRIKL
jgi:hypothetical protein